jgi:hypothetical protein
MSVESSVSEDGTGGSPSEREALSAQTEFLWQALKETASLVMKASAFYLAAMAAILGFVLSHPLAPQFRVRALWIVTTVSLLFIIAVGAVGWGLWTGVRDLQSAQEMLSADAFAKLRLHRFFARARVVFWVVTITTLLTLVILLTAIGRSLLE